MYRTKITYRELYDIVENNIGTVKVNTPTGYELVTNAYKKYSPGITLKYTDGTETTGSVNHLMFDEPSNDFLPMSTMCVGDYIGNKIISNVTNLPAQEWIDFTVDALHESYYQNGILHHNSGKSLVTYLMVHAILAKILDGQKILITVPTISLVSQLFNDFKDYSVNNSWDVDEYVHTIIGGSKKHTSKPIIISTWQSLHTIKDKEYFEQFGAIIGDECHTTAASSLSAIMEKSINAFYRIGLSGTLNGTQIAEMALIGHFGPISRVSSTADLINRDILAKLKIFLLTLTYPEEICNSVKYLDYAGEMDWIVKCEQRNKYIVNLSNELKGNTLILVQYIEKHGKVLEQMLRSKCKDKQVFFVYGDTEAEDRESVRRITEKRNDVIILASYQVFSTGVNIKNLPNIILGSSTKSTIRLLQSIGRGLRKHDEKEYCKIFDITDDLRGKRKKLNYTLKHCMERLKIYQTEGFDITEKTITIKGM